MIEIKIIYLHFLNKTQRNNGQYERYKCKADM